MSKKIVHIMKINISVMLFIALLVVPLTILVMPGSVSTISAWYPWFVLGWPDLAINDFSCRNCYYTWSGFLYCDIIVTVSNIGRNVAPRSILGLRYKGDTINGYPHYWSDPNVPFASQMTPSLDIGESYTHVFPRKQIHSMWIVADYFNWVWEINEGNNLKGYDYD